MAYDQSDPIANTAAFRAFNHTGEPADAKPARRRPSMLVYGIALVVLLALVLGLLAYVL